MGIKTYHSISFLKENGHIITSTQNIENSIERTLSNISCSNALAELFLSTKHIPENTVLNFNSRSTFHYNIFTESELKNALKHSHLSAPGPDGVIYLPIKYLSQKLLKNLLNLYNRTWSEEIFPDAWHTIIIISSHKPGKDAFDPKNYRPIALARSCL